MFVESVGLKRHGVDRLQEAITGASVGGRSVVRPALIDDIGTWPLFPATSSSEAVHIVGNKKLNRFLTVGDALLPVVQQALRMFDGSCTLAQIEGQLRDDYGLRVDLTKLYRQLAASGLLRGSETQAQMSDVDRMTLCLVDIPVERLSPAFYRVLKTVSTIVFPATVAFLLIFLLALGFGWLGHATPVRGGSGQMGLLWLAVLFVSVGVHELSHAMAAAHFGITILRFRISVYLGFIPFVYLQLSGLYTLSRARRIIVWLAGLYSNLVLGCVLIILDHYQWQPTVQMILHNAAALNLFLAAANLVPFLPTDGYYVLSTLLRRHNVRSHAWVLLRSVLRGRPSGSMAFFPAAYLVTSIGVMLSLLYVEIEMVVESPQARHLPVALSVIVMVLLALTVNWYHRRGLINSRLLVIAVNWVAMGGMLYIAGLLPPLKAVLRPFS